MIPRAAADLKDRIVRDRDLRSVVDALLDRCDRAGALPAAMVYRCAREGEREALVRLLSPKAVREIPSAGSGSPAVRLDLDRADRALRDGGGPSLRELLYAAAGRIPRDLRGEKAALAAKAAAGVAAMAGTASGAAGAFLRDAAERIARGEGEDFRRAWEDGLDGVMEELRIVAGCIAAAGGNDGPVRLANFSRRATGSTKGVRAGDRRYTRMADALLRFLPGLADGVEAESPRDPSERRRLALESLGIFRNETPVDVLCYGDFTLEKRGARLDAPSAHHTLGEPVRLLLLALRGARVLRMRASRIVSIENETTFNDYVDGVKDAGGGEIVLCSQGQANWAVVRLLRLLHEADPSVPVFHWGDMDRSGVLILRSLRRRSNVPVRPLHMDPETFRRFLAQGLPLPPGEAAEIDRLLAKGGDDTGSDLLAALRETGTWVEQETVADGVLRATGK
ncbi:MAG: hypothetical protein OHK0028_15040 [Deltaproteobacteria bacterium]